MYKYRYLQHNLAQRPSMFRALLVTGPRRSGKSTLALQLQKQWGGGSYVSFDTPLEQARFKADPRGFLNSLQLPAILDEVQNVPEVFNYLKEVIDAKPESPCDYLLTGSQHFQMMRHVSESLAGRVLIKELLPFSQAEATDIEPLRIMANVSKLLHLDHTIDPGDEHNNVFKRERLMHILERGGFPPVVLTESSQDRVEWFNSYVETYVQRDVRALSNIQDLTTYSRFISLGAGRSAQIINHSELGKDLGINYKTVQHYLSLLETSYLWKSLAPYYQAGSEKRITKSPKGIFTDTGLLMFLTGLQATGLGKNPMLGSVFESFVIMELIKLITAFGHRVNFCHFRVGNTSEVDLVLEFGTTLVPIEIKCSASPDASWGKGIDVLREVARLPKDHPGFVLSLAPKPQQLARDVWSIPLSSLC